MRCIICSSDDWENVDKYRLKQIKEYSKNGELVKEPINMCICKKCGFVSYPSLWKTEEEIKEFYKKDYRKPPYVASYYQGKKKIVYHRAFLEDVLKEFVKKNKDNGYKPDIAEVGCAHGMWLHYLKSTMPFCNVSGTEWTQSMKRVCFIEHNIQLQDDFDDKKQYDLICSYKVAEHMQDVDIQLRKYAECLKPGGYLYISVPTWFKFLYNFGKDDFDIEYYYSTNHINVWTQKLFETLLKKCGLKVIKFNDTYYDETYLCVRDDELMKEEPQYEDPEKIKALMEKAYLCYEKLTEGDFKTCIELWPQFPVAWVNFYESNRSTFDKIGFDKIKVELIDKMLEQTNNYYLAYCVAGDIANRYSKWETAINYFNQANTKRPNHLPAIMGIGHSLHGWAKETEDQEKKTDLYLKARDCFVFVRDYSNEHYDESVNWIYYFDSQIPIQEAQ